jgi:hypothetical protein
VCPNRKWHCNDVVDYWREKKNEKKKRKNKQNVDLPVHFDICPYINIYIYMQESNANVLIYFKREELSYMLMGGNSHRQTINTLGSCCRA